MAQKRHGSHEKSSHHGKGSHGKKAGRGKSHATRNTDSDFSEDLKTSFEELDTAADHVSHQDSWTEKAEHEGEYDANVYNEKQTHSETESSTEEPQESRLEFPYSDILRAYVPEAMKVADKAATDWKQDGSFMNLGIENPYANMVISAGLQKAKEVEKKLEEKGVLSTVRMGIEVLKQQVNKRK